MQVGIITLGRMIANDARRLVRHGHDGDRLRSRASPGRGASSARAGARRRTGKNQRRRGGTSFAALAPGTGKVPAAGRDERDLECIPAGSSGARRFVVHYGIEYHRGLRRAFPQPEKCREALPEAERLNLHITDIAEVLRRGRVITSWLLNVAACALANDPSLDASSGFVGESGKRRWTEPAAIDDAVAVDLLAAALFARILSCCFAEKMQP